MKRFLSVSCFVLSMFALALLVVARLLQPEAVQQVVIDRAPLETPAAVVSSPEPIATPEPTPAPEPEYYTLSFVGDCTLWSSQNYAQHPAGFKGTINGDYSYPFANTVQYFEEDDFTLANLECILSDRQLGYDYTTVSPNGRNK